MNSTEDRPLPPTDEEWARMWQGRMASLEDSERVARTIMAQVWRFDQTLFWRNAREYAAGIVLLVVFVGQLVIGDDRVGALVGIGSVGFVIGYLWWKHRGLQPLDPAVGRDRLQSRPAGARRRSDPAAAQRHLLVLVAVVSAIALAGHARVGQESLDCGPLAGCCQRAVWVPAMAERHCRSGRATRHTSECRINVSGGMTMKSAIELRRDEPCEPVCGLWHGQVVCLSLRLPAEQAIPARNGSIRTLEPGCSATHWLGEPA